MWFILILSLQVGMDDGVARYEEVEVRFKTLASCRYVENRISGVVRIKQNCTQLQAL